MIRWGLLGTARIGTVVAHATGRSQRARFAAVGSRDAAKGERFAREHGIPRSFGSYEALIASDTIDAIYVALPPALHVEWTVRALEAGKHAVSEKPFSDRASEVERAFDAAERGGLLCTEALAYRHHPQTALVRRLVADGAIGQLKHVRSALSCAIAEVDIRRVRSLGGGSLMDLGCYCVSASRLVAGEPERVFGEAASDGAEVDMHFAATMRHANGVTASFDCGFELPRRDELELIGTDGVIVVSDPWLARGRTVRLIRPDGTTDLPVDAEDRFGLRFDDYDVYRIAMDAISEDIESGRAGAFGRADAVAQARVIEGLLRSADLMEPQTLPPVSADAPPVSAVRPS